ncbi:MAG: nucleotide exchange factor GrpE [Cyclobacteriaceae bacterium]|nr:nucleotide exchange factor GrpE [Cyclobacteriaceae bacterium]
MEENNQSQAETNTNEDLVSENPVEETTGQDNNDPSGADQNSPLLKAQADLAESKDKFIRLYSEFENFRRRTAKEKLEMVQSANEQLIKSLLPVVDDFERAEKSFQNKNDQDTEGFFLIHNKFKKVLDQYGVKVMEVASGSDFNVDQHEAITQVPAPEEKLKGKVIDVVEKGYVLNEKVIRFAKVVIGS